MSVLIARANTASIFDVLNDFAHAAVEPGIKSAKWPCPWGYEHPDGGLDPGFRTYPDTNTAYCFVLHGSMDPVRVVQIHEDVPRVAAAGKICRRYGLSRPPWRARYDEVLRDREAARHVVGTASIAAALHTALKDEADPSKNPELSDALSDALDELDEMIGTADEDAVRRWYRETRARLLSLKEESTSG